MSESRSSTPNPARTSSLKELILDLHDGLPPEAARQRFDDLIRDVAPGEIGAMEESLIQEGMPVQQIQRLCDLHVAVMKGGLERQPALSVPTGHPAHTYQAENRIISGLADRLGKLAAAACGSAADASPGDVRLGDDAAPDPAAQALSLLGELAGVHNHYLRKENQLFPYLERHGITGPPKVMWGVHDQIRAQLKQARSAAERWAAFPDTDPAAADPRREAGERMATLARSLVEMVFKEDRILLPLALQTLSPGEWIEVRRGEDEMGYAYGAPGAPWPPAARGIASPSGPGGPVPVGAKAGPSSGIREAGSRPRPHAGPGLSLPIVSPSAPPPSAALPAEGMLDLGTGRLSLEQVDMILRHLPVDLSFVDADGFVRYYSETPERLFPRTPGAIGRHVENCHPPKSVHMVKEILRAFAAGEREVAEFWIQMQGRFIHIRYFAVRSEAGEYVGCLEVSQDVTGIRALEGERRLLEWS